MQSVVMLRVNYAECHLWSFKVSVTNKPIVLTVFMLNVVILSVVAPNKANFRSQGAPMA